MKLTRKTFARLTIDGIAEPEFNGDEISLEMQAQLGRFVQHVMNLSIEPQASFEINLTLSSKMVVELNESPRDLTLSGLLALQDKVNQEDGQLQLEERPIGDCPIAPIQLSMFRQEAVFVAYEQVVRKQVDWPAYKLNDARREFYMTYAPDSHQVIYLRWLTQQHR